MTPLDAAVAGAVAGALALGATQLYLDHCQRVHRSRCQNPSEECPDCERRVCARCGRCFERLPSDPPGTWRRRCPSRWCRWWRFVKAVLGFA